MIPPILRRVFNTSPLAAPLILILIVVTLLLGFSSDTRASILSSTWVGGHGVGGPVRAGEAARVDNSNKGPAAPPPDSNFVDYPPLPEIYTGLFPNLRMPAKLSTRDVMVLGYAVDDFLRRPILTHSEARPDNWAGCAPPEGPGRTIIDDAQLLFEAEFWRTSVNEKAIAGRRAELVQFLEDKLQEGKDVLGWEHEGMSGRGIVMTAGNGDTVERALTVLRHLKRIGDTLPVQIFHYPGELTDSGKRKELESFGAKIFEVKDVHPNQGAWKNWQIKAFAIIQSTFREVISLDSDNIPLRPLNHLFDAATYTLGGRAVFWPDLSKDHPDNPIWRIVGETCSLDEWTFESGQIVIDKQGNNGLNLAALWLAAGMMHDTDFWFKLNGGDKDTFRWAFKMLGIPYGHSPRFMSSVGFMNEMNGGGFCGHTTLQYDLVEDPAVGKALPLFVHSNLLKHLGAPGVGPGKPVFSHVLRMTKDSYDEPTLNYLHMWVYEWRGHGLCVTGQMYDGAVDGMTEKEKEEQKLVIIPISELEGNVLDGFEQIFLEEGGRIGGM